MLFHRRQDTGFVSVELQVTNLNTTYLSVMYFTGSLSMSIADTAAEADLREPTNLGQKFASSKAKEATQSVIATRHPGSVVALLPENVVSAAVISSSEEYASTASRSLSPVSRKVTWGSSYWISHPSLMLSKYSLLFSA